jgi:hypothetical protein
LLVAVGTALALAGPSSAIAGFGWGLLWPGAGFLGIGPAGLLQGVVPALLAFAAFVLSLAIWFGTGNVLLPLFVWLASAVAAAFFAAAPGIEPTGAPAATIAALTVSALALAGWRAGKRRDIGTAAKADAVPIAFTTEPDVLSGEDLARLRLLLDRALQPIERFDGFQRRDQFQTAALRYQLNFIAYALALAQARCLPAYAGEMDEAQLRLAAKLQDRRVWGYWRLENLWGNLDPSPDPLKRDNIMFAGFVLTQLALARASSAGRLFGADTRLVFAPGDGENFTYGVADIAAALERQYRDAPFCLLPCEPNWIYPLCNAITACGMAALDAQDGSARWAAMSERFRHGLDTEFTRGPGAFIPIRSSLTGLGLPGAGGPMMQAFTCYWLNPVLPDLAAYHWEALSRRLREARVRATIWPIDVGDYRWSRAAGYVAIAAAAREMGDAPVADRMLELLDQECRVTSAGRAAHRANASLWTHAVEIMAHMGGPGQLRALVNRPPCRSGSIEAGPLLARIDETTQVAGAHRTSGGLHLALDASGPCAVRRLAVTGLAPGRLYRAIAERPPESADLVQADATGGACFALHLAGRSHVIIKPEAN